MSMDNTKRVLKIYQNAAVNLRRVADELVERGSSEQSTIIASRTKASLYETFARDLELALIEDKVLTITPQEGP